jgi:hypothetical protein
MKKLGTESVWGVRSTIQFSFPVFIKNLKIKVNKSLLTDFSLSQWFTVIVISSLEFVHHVDVVSGADVPEVPATSIFRYH